MDEILRQHDIKEYFISILGTDGTDEKSKKTKYIGEIVKKYKLENQQTAIIGDTKEDISAGKNNSIYTVGITWGYGSESDLVEAGADAVYHNVSEIKNL
jgi:phosphoglycolate phosphatase